MSGLVHLMSEHDWERVAESAPAGDLVTPPEGGFVHLSAPGQVAVAADRHFAGRRDLVLLELDPARLSGLDLRWEEGDPPEGDLRVQQLHARMLSQRAPLLLDVREPEEWAICHLEGAQHIPLGQLPTRLGELDADQEVVVYCHHGIRSAYAVMMMRQAGFTNPRNLLGGIDAWAQRVDTEMPVY